MSQSQSKKERKAYKISAQEAIRVFLEAARRQSLRARLILAWKIITKRA